MAEYIKQKSVPRLEDKIINRGLNVLDEELSKVSNVINANVRKAFEFDSNEDYQPVSGRFFDPHFEEDNNGDIMPRLAVIFEVDSSNDVMPS